MEDNVVISKALGLPGPVEGVVLQQCSVHGQEHRLAVRPVGPAQRLPQPALNASSLIIIGSCAFPVILLPALKTIHIKLAHVSPNPVKIFDQFTVCHFPAPLYFRILSQYSFELFPKAFKAIFIILNKKHRFSDVKNDGLEVSE